MKIDRDRHIVEHGPSIGRYRGRDIPAYIVTESGTRQIFDRAALQDEYGGVELSQLAPNECVIAPGLIYREVPHAGAFPVIEGCESQPGLSSPDSKQTEDANA